VRRYHRERHTLSVGALFELICHNAEVNSVKSSFLNSFIELRRLSQS
jgi:hypothetical protein